MSFNDSFSVGSVLGLLASIYFWFAVKDPDLANLQKEIKNADGTDVAMKKLSLARRVGEFTRVSF